MSITLLQEFVSCNEACISWTISPYSINSNSKPILCLSDINQSGINAYSTVKYLIRPNEIFQGTHTFTQLTAGEYTAEIIIITGNASENSEPLPITVYQVDTPVFQTNGIISGNKKFTVTLEQPTCDMTNGTVTFILYGQSFLLGNTQSTRSGIINKVLSYSLNNTYIIDNNDIQNNSEYEITCFYTNSVNISGLLPQAILKRPTNTPNQITNLVSIYDAAAQTLTITYTPPSNETDYDLIDCRATITDNSNNVTYYYSSENSAILSPAPSATSPIVFNMNNKNLLPVDVPFTITLSAKSEINLWGPQESPAIKCVFTNNFSAVPLSVSDLTFSVGLNSISTSDNNTYAKNNAYAINYTASVYNSNSNGDIVGSAIDTKRQTNNMNFEFTNLTTGNLYKMIINLNYTFTFDDNTTVTIEQHIMNTCYKYFIPHIIAEQLTISATPNDQSVLVNWLPITQEELKGFILDHYEVSDDNNTWTNKNTSLSHNFTSGLTNGIPHTFYVRAVSNSGTTLYMSGETINGQTANVTSIPYGTPSNLTRVSQLPGDRKCTVVWTIPADPYNGGLFNTFEASVNSSLYSPIVHSFADNQYTYEFPDLNNLVSNSILIRLVNNNQSNLKNINTIKKSDSLSIVTTPFSLPAVPSNFHAAPSTMSVMLTWNAVTPASIISNSVEYELYYKLRSDSDFTIVSNIATNSYEVPSLTSNSMYDFKIRSTIRNTEVNNTFNSEFTPILSSRPFIYLNAPNMVLEPGSGTIVVKLTSNVNNYFQTTFKYHAIVSNTDGTNPKTITLSTNSQVQDITFNNLGDNTVLVDLTQYKVEAYYEMLNTDNELYYSSNSVSSFIKPFNAGLAPVLRSLSSNSSVLYTFNISAFAGYTNKHYEYSVDNISWSNITNISSQSETEISFNISNLVNGTSYDLYVKVIYEVNGELEDSNVSNKVTNIPYTTPSAPTNLTNTPGDKQIIFNWQAPSSLNGLNLHHYEVKRDYPENPNNDTWINVGTDISYTFTGLANTVVYTMYVRAVTLNVLEGNVYVIGDSASSYNVPYAIPSAPTFVSCVESNAQLRLTWNTNTTGSLLEGFGFHTFMGSYDNGVNWIKLTDFVGSYYFHDSQNPAYLFTGLTNGQSYTLKVYAVISHPVLGEIAGNILTVGPFIPFENPSPPIFVSCDEGNEKLTPTWSGPTSLGGLSLHHYEVRANTNSWIDAGINLSHIITPLINGEVYTISIKAVVSHPNLGLIDGNVFTSTSTFIPYTTSIAPTFKISSSFPYVNQDTNHYRFVMAVNKLPGTFINNSWEETIGSNTGGLPVTSYEYSIDSVNWITMYNARDINTIDINATDQPSSGGFYLSAPEIGNTKTVSVRAVCTHPNLGLIPGIIFNRNFLVYVTPSIPIISTIVPGDMSLTINWSPMVPYVTGTNSSLNTPGVMNGLPFAKFQVADNYYGNGTNWIDVGSDTSYTFTELINGTSYSPLVRSVGYDEYANSPQYIQSTTILGRNATFSANTPYAPASAPTLNAIQQQDTQLTLTWNKPALGGLPLIRYEMSIDNVNWTSSIGNSNYTDNETVASFIFTSLTNGNRYNLRVRAITSHPVLGEIEGSTFTTLEYVPYKVADEPEIIVIPSNQQILLQWSTPYLGGLIFNKYEISYNGTTYADLNSEEGLVFFTDNTNSSVTFTGLVNGTNYKYYIRIKTTHPNLGIINGLSRYITSTPFIKPNVVSNIVCSAINNYLTFSFTAPANSNNNVIPESYEYSIDGGNVYNPLYQLTNFTTSIGEGGFSLKIRVFIVNPNDSAIKIYGDVVTVNNLQNINITTPQNIQTVFGDKFVTMNWDEVSNITFQILRYFEDGTVYIDYTTGSSYTFNNLINGVAYKFGINIYTNGIAGPVSSVTVTPMTTPTINSVSKSGDILYINVDFGGASTINVDFLAAFATGNTISGVTRSTIITNAPNVNPLSFSGMSPYNYFNITIANKVGTTSETYTR